MAEYKLRENEALEWLEGYNKMWSPVDKAYAQIDKVRAEHAKARAEFYQWGRQNAFPTDFNFEEMSESKSLEWLEGYNKMWAPMEKACAEINKAHDERVKARAEFGEWHKRNQYVEKQKNRRRKLLFGRGGKSCHTPRKCDSWP